MKKWKPDVKWAKVALAQVNKLIKMYKDGHRPHCPLCAIRNISKVKAGSCEACPWMLFKGADCLDSNYNEDSFKKRLYRLYGWKVRLQNIINKES